MTNETNKPICFLGQPCFDAECDYCNARKLAAVRKSAGSAFFPTHHDRRVVVGILGWFHLAVSDFEFRSLQPNLSDACKLANLENERVLAGAYIRYMSKGIPGYLMGWAFALDVPRGIRAGSVARRLKLAFTELVPDEDLQSSFEDAKPGASFDAHLGALFLWNSKEIKRCLAITPRQHGAAIDGLLNSVRSNERIYAQNLDRAADGLFLPSPYRPAKNMPRRSAARGDTNSNVPSA